MCTQAYTDMSGTQTPAVQRHQPYTDMSHARTSRMAVASIHAGQQLLNELLNDYWGSVEVNLRTSTVSKSAVCIIGSCKSCFPMSHQNCPHTCPAYAGTEYSHCCHVHIDTQLTLILDALCRASGPVALR